MVNTNEILNLLSADIIGTEEKTKDSRFYIDFTCITYCYPYDISRKTQTFGVLSEYKGRYYTLSEINKIAAELIIRIPYMEGSSSLKIRIMQNGCYHHILDIHNYNYKEQPTKGDNTIKYTV